MSDFLINEGTFDVGDGWDDKSVTALTFPSGSHTPEASFTVTRDPLGAGTPAAIGHYVDEQLSKLARSCQQFDLLRRDDVTISDRPAELIEFSWKTPDGAVVRQVQGVLILEGMALVLTGTAPKSRFADFSGIFQNMIASFRTRQ